MSTPIRVRYHLLRWTILRVLANILFGKGNWLNVYMVVGKEKNLTPHGPYFTEELGYINKTLLPWLKNSRNCESVKVCITMMPRYSYYSMIPTTSEMP